MLSQQLTWIDGLGNVITTGIKYVAEPLPDGKRFRSKSVLKMKPQKEHHNTSLTCQSQNSADRNFKTTEVKIEVSVILHTHTHAHFVRHFLLNLFQIVKFFYSTI